MSFSQCEKPSLILIQARGKIIFLYILVFTKQVMGKLFIKRHPTVCDTCIYYFDIKRPREQVRNVKASLPRMIEANIT